MNTSETPIQRAIRLFGPANKFAAAINVSPQFMTQMVKGQRPVPPQRCLAIEEATKGAVTRYELRPDVFGEPPASNRAA